MANEIITQDTEVIDPISNTDIPNDVVVSEKSIDESIIKTTLNDPIYKTKDGRIFTKSQLLKNGYDENRINDGVTKNTLSNIGDTKDPEQKYKHSSGKVFSNKELVESGYDQTRIDAGIMDGKLSIIEKKNQAVTTAQPKISSNISSDGGVPSTTPTTEPIKQNDEKQAVPISTETEPPARTLFDDAKDYMALKNKKKIITESVVGVEPGTYDDIQKEVDDTDAQLTAKQIKEQGLVDKVDYDELGEVVNLVEEAQKNNLEIDPRLVFSSLENDYVNNHSEFVSKVATLRYQNSLVSQFYSHYGDNATSEWQKNIEIPLSNLNTSNWDEYRKGASAFRQNIANILTVGDFDNKNYILDNIQKTFSSQYGYLYNRYPELAEVDPLNKSLNDNQILGYRYMQDLAPEVVTKYNSALLSDEDVSTNWKADLSRQNARKSLELIGANLRISSLQGNIADRTKWLNESVEKINDITQRIQTEKDPGKLAELLQEYQNEYDNNYSRNKKRIDYLYNLSDKLKSNIEGVHSNPNYNLANYYERQNLVQELLGQKHTILRPFMKIDQGIYNIGAGLVDYAKSFSSSDRENDVNTAITLGFNDVIDSELYARIENRMSQNEEIVMTPEFKRGLESIKNNTTLSEGDKAIKLDQFIQQNADGIQRTPKGHETNITLNSLLTGMTDLAADIAPYLAVEALSLGSASGGIAPSMLRKFTASFTAAFLTGYEQSYVEALRRGSLNPYADAMRSTVLNSLAMAGAGTPDLMRKLIGTNTAIGKYINKLTDSEINAALRQSPEAVSKFKSLYNFGTKIAESAKESAIGGAKMIGLTSAAQSINNSVLGEEVSLKDQVDEGKVELLKFTLFGVFTGGIARGLNEKYGDLTKAAVYMAGENPTKFLEIIKEQRRNNQIDEQKFNEIKNNIDNASALYKNTVFIDANGKPLSDRNKRDFLFLKMQEKDLNDIANKTMPEDLKKAVLKRALDIKEEINKIYNGNYLSDQDKIREQKISGKIEVGAIIKNANGQTGRVKQINENGSVVIEDIENKLKGEFLWKPEEIIVDKTTVVEPAEAPIVQSVETEDQKTQPVEGDQTIDESDITVGEVINGVGKYKGQKGTFYLDGKTVIFAVDGTNKEFEIGNIDEIKDDPINDFDIEHDKSVVTIGENGQINVRGKEYRNNFSEPSRAINRDAEGNIVSVTLETPNGERRTFRGNVADDIAYQIELQKITKNDATRTEFEQFAGTDPDAQQLIESGANTESAPEVTTEAVPNVRREKITRPRRTAKPKFATKKTKSRGRTISPAVEPTEGAVGTEPIERIPTEQSGMGGGEPTEIPTESNVTPEEPISTVKKIGENLGITLDEPKTNAERQTLADKIRALKSKPGKTFESTLGVPVAIWDGSMELLAKSVEGGIAVKEAIENAISYIKKNWSKELGKLNEQGVREYFSNIRKPKYLATTNVLGNTGRMKKNANYQKAKAGDNLSAIKLVQELLNNNHIAKIKSVLAKNPNAIIVPIFAIEQTGKNKIPLALANAIAKIGGNKVDADIFLANKPSHTTKSRIERFFSYPEFEGDVVKGADYIITDDVSTMGGTLKALKDYIENNGGNVVDGFVLGVGRLGNSLEAPENLKEKLTKKFGENELNLFLNETGRKNINSLTANEIKLLESFPSLDAIREAGTNAGQKRGNEVYGNLQYNKGSEDGVSYLSESNDADYTSGNPLSKEEIEAKNSRSIKAVWNKYKNIQFTGTTTVKNAEDVAHIMQLLENKTVEQAYAVHIDKNGKSHIQFLGIGGITGTVVDPRMVLAGAKKFKSVHTILTHNHPSGNMTPSVADLNITAKIRKGLEPLGIKIEHVIMDTFKKEYVHIDEFNNPEVKQRNQNLQDKVKLSTYILDEQEILNNPISQVRSSVDAANFIQQLRFSAMPKSGTILLDQANKIIGNYVFKGGRIDYEELTDFIGDSGTGVSFIFYGNHYDANVKSMLESVKSRLSELDIRVLDYIVTGSDTGAVKDYYKSLADDGLLYETQTKYGTNIVKEGGEKSKTNWGVEDYKKEIKKLEQEDAEGNKEKIKKLINELGAFVKKDVLENEKQNKLTDQKLTEGTSSIKEAIDNYENNDKGSFNDLVDDIEGIAYNEENQKLQDAVDAYRQEQADDFELAGRNDMDAAENVFMRVVQSELSKQKESVQLSKQKQVEQLRAEEQAKLDEAIPNAEQYRVDGKVDRSKLTSKEDIKAFDKIYNKYDKLITPLLKETEIPEQKISASVIDAVNVELKDNQIRGRLLNEKQSEELQKEIESKYSKTSSDIFSKDVDDIRMNMGNYSSPLAETTINGIDVRIATGLIKTNKEGVRERTILLYADGKIVGEFYSINDAKEVVNFIKTNLVKSLPTKAELPQQKGVGEVKRTFFHGGRLDSEGDIFLSPNKEIAKEYASINEGKVKSFSLDENRIMEEDEVREIINDLGLENKEGDTDFEDLLLHELLDPRFDTSLSKEDIAKVKNEIIKREYDAISYNDEDITGKSKGGTESILVINNEALGVSKLPQQKGVEKGNFVKDKNGNYYPTKADLPKGFAILETADNDPGYGRLFDNFGYGIMEGSIDDIAKELRDSYPIGTSAIKDGTNLDLYSNINKFTLKQFETILQNIDPQGEWNTMVKEVDGQPNEFQAKELETELLAESRDKLREYVTDMLKSDKADEYIGFDIPKDGLGKTELPQPITEPKTAAEKKTIADQLRQLKSGKGKAYDAVLGVPVAIWDGAVELIAKAIEGSTEVAEAIRRGINYIEKNHRGRWDKQGFNQKVIESLGFRGIRVNGEDVVVKPMVDKQSAEVINGFYSPLEQGILNAKAETLTGKEWADKLQASTEADELRFTGMSDFLSQNADKSLTKQEVLDYMKNNRIQINEIQLGEGQRGEWVKKEDGYYNLGDKSPEDKKYRIVDEGTEYNEFSIYRGKSHIKTVEGLEEAKEEAEYIALQSQGLDFISKNSKYSDYQLLGESSNYKEILITLPKSEVSIPKFEVGEKIKFKLHGDIFDGKIIEIDKDDYYTIKHNGSDYYIKYDDILNAEKTKITEFKSSHFDEPNILAHIRMNTRVDAEGNKVVHVEEFQSDWGKAGREEGFISQKERTKGWKIEETADKSGYHIFNPKGELVSFEFNKEDAEAEVNDLANTSNETGAPIPNIPEAPFVTETGNWVKLAWKVALKEAVKEGADKITWTTGEQQNERYDLSKSVNYIRRFDDRTNEDRSYIDISTPISVISLVVDNRIEKGKILESKSSTTYIGKNLADVIGKEIAEKTMNLRDGQELSGENLTVGGTGMKGFYGSPSEGKLGIVGDVIKSMIGQEPKTTILNRGATESLKAYEYDGTQDVSDVPGSNYIKEGDWVVKSPTGVKMVIEASSKEEAIQEFKDAASDADVNIPSGYESVQHSIDITPEIKEGVKTGMALFQSPFQKLANGIRKLKSEKGKAYDAVLGIPVAIWDGAVELIATSVEAIEGTATAIEKGIKYIQNTDWYRNLSSADKIKANKEFVDRINSIPGVSKQLQKEEGTSKKTLSILYNGRLTAEKRKQGILEHIVAAENVSDETKVALIDNGITYEAANNVEAEQIATDIIKAFGVGDALTIARGTDVHPSVRSAIFAKAIDDAYTREINATSESDQMDAAEQWSSLVKEYADLMTAGGQFTSYAAHFYKTSPMGFVMRRNADTKARFSDWIKGKEKDYNALFEMLKNAPEGKELLNVELENIRKEERKNDRAKRDKSIDDFFNKLKINPNNSYGFIIPLPVLNPVIDAMKVAVKAGDRVVDVVQRAIEQISEKVGDDWNKEKFRKEYETLLHKAIDNNRKEPSVEESLKKRIEGLEKQIKDYEEKVKKGGVPGQKPVGKFDEVEEVKKLITERDNLRKQNQKLIRQSRTISGEMTRNEKILQERIKKLEDELDRVTSRRNKEKPTKGSPKEKQYTEKEKELKDAIAAENEKWDNEIDQERKNANDYKKLETERNRQLKRVSDLKEKLKILESGKLPESKQGEPKKDIPEIEALKQEINEAEKVVRENISYQKKLTDLETELQRLKDRKRKEQDPEKKSDYSEEEALLRKQIEDERLAWKIEDNVNKLKEDLRRVKDRIEKETDPKQKRKLTEEETNLVNEIKSENKKWSEEKKSANEREEKIKNIKKQISDYKEKIAKGGEANESKEIKFSDDAEIQKLIEEREALKKENETLLKNAKAGKYSDESKNESAQKSAQKTIDKLQEKLDNNELEIEESEKLNETQKTKDLRAERKKLREELEQKRKDAKVGKYSDDAKNEMAQKNAQKSINDLQEKLDNNELEIEEADKLNETQKTKDLREKRKQLRKELEDRRKAEKVGKYSDEAIAIAEVKRKQNRIDELNRRINEKDFSAEKYKERKEKDDLQKQLDETKKAYDEAKKTSPEWQEKKTKQFLDKFRDRIKGADDKQKEEIVRKSIKKLAENGALKQEEFRKIVAEVMGYKDLTPEQVQKVEQLTQTINSVDDIENEMVKNPTEDNFKAYEKAKQDSMIAGKQLYQMTHKKSDIIGTLKSIITGGLLGVPTLVMNVAQNITQQGLIRFPISVVRQAGELSQYGITSLLSKAGIGKAIEPTSNIALAQKAYFKGYGRGFKRGWFNFYKGVQERDYFGKTSYNTTLDPKQAFRDLKSFWANEINLDKKEIADRMLKITLGWQSDFILRGMGFGDRPQRWASEQAKAVQIATMELGLIKDNEIQAFMLSPKKYAYKVLVEGGMEKAKAELKADEIEQRIIEEGGKAVLEQENALSWISKKADQALLIEKDEGLISASAKNIMSLVKTTTFPFVKIPANVYWTMFKLINPQVSILQAGFHLSEAGVYKKKGNDIEVRRSLEKAKDDMAFSVIGYGVGLAAMSLVNGGYIRSENDEETTAREAAGEKKYGKQSQINLGAMWGGEDFWVDLKWFGPLGTELNVKNKIEEKKKRDLLKGKEVETTWLSEKTDVLTESAAESFNNLVFDQGARVINAMKNGDDGAKIWFVQSMNTLSSAVTGATYSRISAAMLPYEPRLKADTWWQEAVNNVKVKNGVIRLFTDMPPARISIWGDPIKRDNSFGGAVKYILGFESGSANKFGAILYEDAVRTQDARFFPMPMTDKLTVGGKEIELTQAEKDDLSIYVGKARAALVSAFVYDCATTDNFRYKVPMKDAKAKAMKYSDPDFKDEDKIKALQQIYDYGRIMGVAEFKKHHIKFVVAELSIPQQELSKEIASKQLGITDENEIYEFTLKPKEYAYNYLIKKGFSENDAQEKSDIIMKQIGAVKTEVLKKSIYDKVYKSIFKTRIGMKVRELGKEPIGLSPEEEYDKKMEEKDREIRNLRDSIQNFNQPNENQ